MTTTPTSTSSRARWLAALVAAALWPISALLTAQAGGAAAPVPQQPSEIEVVIGGDGGTPPRYAVPDFVALTPDAADTAKTLGQVLWDDLEFEREFYLIARDTYSTVPVARSAEQVPFASWRELGADAVFFGTVQRTGDTVRVQVRLFNVKTRQSVFAKEYSGTAANPRLYAHTIADEVHLQQRSLRGVARTKLAFVSDRNRERLIGPVDNREVKEIYVSDYDGANQRRITTTRQLNLNPSWSPDARAVAYSSYRNITPQIFISLIYQGLLENATKNVGSNYMPMFSPDGTRIAFISNRDGNPEVYVMNRDGSNVRRLTNHPAGDSTPTWSPTGAQLAFTSDRSGQPQIYTMNSADGSNIRRLTTGESNADRATWSPAPYNEIAYAARTGGWYDIKIHDLSTGQVRQITFSEGSNEGPAYSPNGTHLAFTSTRAGGTQVFTIGRDGKGLKQITRSGNNTTPAWSR
jgi:TolB protein